MRRVESIILALAAIGLIILAALSGVWMKPEKADKVPHAGPDITIVIPPTDRAPAGRETEDLPDAQHYPL